MINDGRNEKIKPTIIKEILADFLKGQKQIETPQTIIMRHWGEIISESAALEAKPILIKNRVLVITVSNSALLHKLTFQKKEICRNIEKFLNSKVIKDVRFKIGNINDC